jgi:hypothetical protein
VTSFFGESVLWRWYRHRNRTGSNTLHTEAEPARDVYATICMAVYNRRMVLEQGPWTIEDTEAWSI